MLDLPYLNLPRRYQMDEGQFVDLLIKDAHVTQWTGLERVTSAPIWQ